MEEHLWEIEHSFYCSGRYMECFYSWDEFVENWQEYDIDLNLIIRWDWNLPTDKDPEAITVFYLLQRKGYITECLVYIQKKDEEKIIEFLKPHWERIQKNWLPIARKAVTS